MADPIEEQRLRTIQREYLDFLDDGVGFSLRVNRIDFLFFFCCLGRRRCLSR